MASAASRIVPVRPSGMVGMGRAAYISSSVTTRSGSTWTPSRSACLARHADMDRPPAGLDHLPLRLWQTEPRLDHAEGNRIDVDAEAAPLLGESTHEAEHPRLGRGVVSGAHQTPLTGEGRDHDGLAMTSISVGFGGGLEDRQIGRAHV